MNLHGYLARERVFYGSEEGIDFTNIYFYTVLFHALRASNNIAIETGETFDGFRDSKYASGEFFDKYTDQAWTPATQRVASLFDDANITIPTQDDWKALKASIQEHGIYNQNLQAVPPTGRSRTSTTRRRRSTRSRRRSRSARKASSAASTTRRRS